MDIAFNNTSQIRQTAISAETPLLFVCIHLHLLTCSFKPEPQQLSDRVSLSWVVCVCVCVFYRLQCRLDMNLTVTGRDCEQTKSERHIFSLSLPHTVSCQWHSSVYLSVCAFKYVMLLSAVADDEV